MIDPERETILILDDTEAIRYAKARALRRAGYHVIEAATGHEALALAEHWRPPLALLDVMLPDINGMEVCRILKEELPEILVLQMSASFVESEDRTRGLENGADGYLVEPVEPSELVANVRALLRLRAANEALRASEERYRLIIESATDYAIFTTDPEGRVTSWNAGAANVLGYEEAEILGQESEILWTPEDIALGCPTAERRSASDKGRAEDERWHVRKNGSRFFAHGIMVPLGSGSGASGFLKILRDRTERRKAEERQEVLVRELHHRVRNTLATVQAVANSTIRSAESLEEFGTGFMGRINALSQTHTLLTEHDRQSAPLRELLAFELGPYADGGARQVTFVGPGIDLPSDLAVPMSMAIHELTTNAVKHGALSVEGGRVTVTWDLHRKDAQQVLRLEWCEEDGPPVMPPTREGFGTRLLERVLGSQLNATVQTDFRAMGLCFVATIPLPRDA